MIFSLAVGAALHATGLVLDPVVVALCLTTTALGTLLPSRATPACCARRSGRASCRWGPFGEFGPIVAVVILLTTATPA